MKSIISKIFVGAALLATTGLVSCVNDLEQLPKDPSTMTSGAFKDNPKQYIAGLAADCYAGMAFSSLKGPGETDIDCPDAGMSTYNRVMFMANEFPTDECAWIYFSDAGVEDMVKSTWSKDNAVVQLIYSRLYTHIAICNDFIRNMRRNLGNWGISPDAALQGEIDQFVREARFLRAFSYYNVIDCFGRAAVAWDDVDYGAIPPQAESRQALFEKVVADLEDVLATWPADHTPVYGRAGRDAVEALLCRFYLNAEVFTEGAVSDGWQKCWQHAQNIIGRHTDGMDNSGLVEDYLSLFAGNNDRYMPGRSGYPNEILFGIPYNSMDGQSYGGTGFIINASTTNTLDDKTNSLPDPTDATKYAANLAWTGLSSSWGCMHARQQFSEKFNFVNGLADDYRASLWLTENAHWNITNDNAGKLNDGYAAIKFSNIPADASGRMTIGSTKWDGDLEIRHLIAPDGYQLVADYPDTDLPVIRLAEVYLMAAECTLHGAGSRSEGLKYVNLLRKRARVAAWSDPDLSEENILDERARELYWENVRRTDLVRMGKFTGSEYVWNWKNASNPGSAMRGKHMDVYPIPQAVVASYPADKPYIQNPGY